MEARLKYILYLGWPFFLFSYFAHQRWAKGNAYKIALMRKKMLWLSVIIFSLAAGWWSVFYAMKQWPPLDLFSQAPALLLLWVTFCLPANIIGSGILNFRGLFAVPDWTKFLDSNERIDWKEFPTANEDTFMIGTNGKEFIKAGWTAPLWERGNYAVVGDLNRGRQNAVNYMLTCGFTPNTTCFCLDGEAVSNVGFRHLRDIDNIFIADNHATILRCVKWLVKILEARLSKQVKSLEPIKFPRVLIVVDENVAKTFVAGWHNKDGQQVYYWPEIHHDLISILQNGNPCNMHVIAAIEPELTWLEMQDSNRVHLEPISLYYSLPRQNEKFTAWVTPHEHACLDVFALRVGNEKIIGKMPFIPESEMREWLLQLVAMADGETKDLWTDSLDRIPKIPVGYTITDAPSLVKNAEGGLTVVKGLKHKNVY